MVLNCIQGFVGDLDKHAINIKQMKKKGWTFNLLRFYQFYQLFYFFLFNFFISLNLFLFFQFGYF